MTFLTRMLPFFGGKQKAGTQHIFDQRGAIQITDKEIKKKNGEIVRVRAISDSGGGGSSMVIQRPASGQFIDAQKAMDAYHSWPYAAIKPIADEIAGIEWRVYRIKKGGDKEELEEHDLIDFLESVNDFQTGPEFKHTLAAHLELTGNAYIYLEGVSTFDSKPKAMHLLNPGKVTINLDKRTYPYKLVNYEFTIDGRKFKYQPYEILQIKYPDPSDPFRGIGTVQGIGEWIDNDNNATEFLRQFFINGAQIGVTFETDMTSEEQLQELRDSFNEQHAGVKNAYKGIFLPKGVKKPVNDVKFDDIGFDEISATNRDKILAGFRVPKTILGAAESETNRATAETADYVFARRTIKPKMILITSYLNEFLVPRFGKDIFLTFVDPVTEDKMAQSNEMKNAVASIPVMTVNEAREEFLGKDPVEGGEKLLAPTTYAPAIDSGKAPVMNFSMTPTKTEEKKYAKRRVKVGYMPLRTVGTRTQFSKNAEIRKGISEAIGKKISELVLSIKKKGLKDMTDREYDDVILKEKADRSAKYAQQMKVELQKLNEAQKIEVMENLDNAIKTVKAFDPKKLFDLDKWINLTVNALTPIAVELFKMEADHALNLIDQPGLDVANTPEAQKAIKHAMDLMGESYQKSTVEMLTVKITEGLEQGFGTAKLGNLISDIYEWRDQYAAERVALTESNRITNTAGKIAWKQTGVVKEVRWITSGRDNVCVFCQEMDGKTIPIDENFFDKGDIIEAGGETMNADYSAIGGPPMHPNCHCNMRPVYSQTVEASAPQKDEIDQAIEDLEHA